MAKEQQRPCYTTVPQFTRDCDSGGFYLCEGCARLMPINEVGMRYEAPGDRVTFAAEAGEG